MALGMVTKNQIILLGKFIMPENIDRSVSADAMRFRWLLNGNGYFMEESSLCGHSPCEQAEKDSYRIAIDKEMEN